MEDYYAFNKDHWDELADLHVKGPYHGVDQFKKGKSSLSPLEVGELGDVKGKNLLHFQCHFGLDTLSWARLGAKVTGVDFSDRAIFHAKKLSKETGIKATFIQSNIFDLPQTVLKPEGFDIIFTSYGTICWLHDLQEWAKLIAYYLKPGGFFYIADSHPTGLIFDDEEADQLSVRYPYFHNPKPLEFNEDGSYADPSAKIENKTEFEWQHDLGEIINSLIAAGLQIEFLHEFPYICWKMLPFLQQKEDGWWHLPEKYENLKVPLMFSLKAARSKLLSRIQL